MTSSFLEYRQAHVDMWNDDGVKEAEKQFHLAQDHLACVMAPYIDRIERARQRIESDCLVMRSGKTEHGVKASYYSGRRSTSWKEVATEVGAPDEIINKHTHYGEPTVKVELIE